MIRRYLVENYYIVAIVLCDIYNFCDFLKQTSPDLSPFSVVEIVNLLLLSNFTPNFLVLTLLAFFDVMPGEADGRG